MNGKVDDVHKQIVAIRPKHAEDFEVLTETYKLVSGLPARSGFIDYRLRGSF